MSDNVIYRVVTGAY